MRALLAAGLLAMTASAQAGEGDVDLKDAPGRDLVAANCSMCHSLDYIQMNSPFLDRKGWEGTVNKMIKVMGAPVAEADAQKIVDYLAAQYGK
ncbi:MAG TPA: cytochrome c [Burkholderiales bacterium]|nr:cytochrome c [Burkholderiales bacterium]